MFIRVHSWFSFSFLRALCVLIVSVLVAGCTPSVHDCIAQDKLDKVATLLNADPSSANSLTEKGKTPVHTAVYYKDFGALGLLASHGADFNLADATGMTPLHDAAQLWRAEEAEWLIEHGANIAAKDMYGDTPAHIAAMVNGGPMLKLLKVHGADLNAKNDEGKTPKDLAREHGNEKAALYIEKLLTQ